WISRAMTHHGSLPHHAGMALANSPAAIAASNSFVVVSTCPLPYVTHSSALFSQKFLTREDGRLNTVRWGAIFKPRPQREYSTAALIDFSFRVTGVTALRCNSKTGSGMLTASAGRQRR